MTPAFWRGNRERLLERLPQKTAALFFSGQRLRRSADIFYDFEPDKHFYYLTGLDREELALLLVKEPGGCREILFLPPVDEKAERWGASFLRPAQAEAISGISSQQESYRLGEALASLCGGIGGVETLFLCQNLTAMDEPPDLSHRWAETLRRQFPHLSIGNALPHMTKLRYRKQPEEIACIQESAEMIARGLEQLRGMIQPGRLEREARAAYEGTLMTAGRNCYGTVCAAGKNALCLHHSHQDGVMEAEDLLLVDVGAPTGYYWADVSRTYPVSGRFTPRQREVYSIVLEAQKKAIEAARPGVLEEELDRLVREHYYGRLKGLGLLDSLEEVDRYYYHNIGHPLGLDVHDLRPAVRRLEEDVVYTIEPGLYIPQWGMGIRIEDDILVTASGCRVLTEGIPKEPEEVEGWLRG